VFIGPETHKSDITAEHPDDAARPAPA
jgi:hypothetical protein